MNVLSHLAVAINVEETQFSSLCRCFFKIREVREHIVHVVAPVWNQPEGCCPSCVLWTSQDLLGHWESPEGAESREPSGPSSGAGEEFTAG